MTSKERDGIDALLFADGVELKDFKCFRGDREDVSEEDIKAQIHSAMMQKRMRRAVVSVDAPRPNVTAVSAEELLPKVASI